jgi:hypothetical protein
MTLALMDFFVSLVRKLKWPEHNRLKAQWLLYVPPALTFKFSLYIVFMDFE